MTGAVADFVRSLLDEGAKSSDFEGCTPDEIEQVRVAQGVSGLPAEYQEFLQAMGRGTSAVIAGEDIFYPYPLELKSDARELLLENGVDDFLDDSALVISMHQGYQFAWMHLDDEKVRLYSEGHAGDRHVWDSLPSFLSDIRVRR